MYTYACRLHTHVHILYASVLFSLLLYKIYTYIDKVHLLNKYTYIVIF